VTFAADDRYIVPALQRGLALLKLFSRERPVIGPPEMATALDLPRTTIFRLAHTLEAMGFLVKDLDGRRYRLGPAVLALGYDFLTSQDLVEIARPVLERLRDQTGLSSHMAVRDGPDAVYVARFPARSGLTSSVQIGARLPTHATVIGRMLLLDLDADGLRELFPHEPLPRYTDRTPTTRAALADLLAGDRSRGWAASRSHFEPGVTAVAVPVRAADGGIVASINLAAVDIAVPPDQLEGPVKDQALAAAAEIGRWLTHQTEGSAPADHTGRRRSA